MTVRELRKALKRMDPDLPVMFIEEIWLVNVEQPKVVDAAASGNVYVEARPGDVVAFKTVLL